MIKNVSITTRIAYCLAVLGAGLPFGLAGTGWAMLAAGRSPMLAIPFVGPILLLAIGLYRTWLVIRAPSTLSCPPAAGVVALIRSAGVLFLYIGAVCTILNWLSVPLMHSLIRSRTDSGIEYFVVGSYLAFIGPIGLFGVILFELSRLRGFEQQVQGV